MLSTVLRFGFGVSALYDLRALEGLTCSILLAAEFKSRRV